MLFYGTVDRTLVDSERKLIVDLLSGRTDPDLDRTALALATVEFPGLHFEPFLALLDTYAAAVAERAHDLSDGHDFVNTANRYLFEELGYRGNPADYYNARNSCLNAVLEDRLGIPITLSVVYMEVARRLAKPVQGIGMPGHFLLKYEDRDYATYIDPFHGGALLSAGECLAMVRVAPPAPDLLAPSSKAQIVRRMINNLRGIYISGRAYGKAVQLLDLLIAADPEVGDEYRERGLVHLQTQQFRAALTDLSTYLKLAPDAEDRAEIEHQISSIQHWMASMN